MDETMKPTPEPKIIPEAPTSETLEEAMENLNAILERMEEGNLPLEQLLEDFEKGAKLIKVCQSRLHAAEKRILSVTKALDGSVGLEAFEPDRNE